MVLDIRHLRKADSASKAKGDDEGAGKTVTPPPASAVKAAHPETDKCLDLETLLGLAGSDEVQERAEAIAQLRALVPSKQGTELLCAIVEDADDSRRQVAAEMLGYHREWLTSHSAAERLLAWAHGERDPEVGSALVWALRGRNETSEFLLHRILGMSREAALGVPISIETGPALVTAVLVGRAPDVDRILLEKLKSAHPSLVGPISELLVEWVGAVGEMEITAVLGCLPQAELFELFPGKRGLPAWDPRGDDEETKRVSQWHQLSRMAETAMLKEPSAELVRHLVNRCARDDAFARRHASFLRAAMANTDAVFGSELLDDLERLTVEASDDRLLRLAEMLLDLRAKFDQRSEAVADDLLEEWKTKSPDLKLKIFHMQQGLQ